MRKIHQIVLIPAIFAALGTGFAAQSATTTNPAGNTATGTPVYYYGMPMMNWYYDRDFNSNPGGTSSTPPEENTPYPNMMYGYNPMWGGYGYMGGWGWIIPLFFWIIIIAAIVSLVRWLWGSDRPRHRGRQAMDILKERYARGEITKEEFEEKKTDLS